jgi:hypothetical protein
MSESHQTGTYPPAQGNRPMTELLSNPYILAIALGFVAWIAADLI